MNATVTDLAGNTNKTETRTIILDMNAPTITIMHPRTQAYGREKNLPLNYTVTDLVSPIDSCWYNVVNTMGIVIPNTTLLNCENILFNVTGDAVYNITVYANDSFGNLGNSHVSFEVVIEPPTTVLNYPIDNGWLNSNPVIFNFTTTDAVGISACELWGNFDGTWRRNQSSINVINANDNLFSLALDDGSYLWNVWCNDTDGYGKFAFQNKTFFVDRITPAIDYGNGTEENDSIFSRNYIYVNVSMVEINPMNITFVLYNSTSLVNSTTYLLSDENSNNSILWTNLSNGYYSYNVTIKDKANNFNSTQTRFITLNTNPPAISFASPLDNSDYSLVLVNITTSPSAVYVWWNNGTANLTYSGPLYYNFSEGENRIYAYANDSASNIGSTTVAFYVDRVLPQTSIIYPTNTVYSGAVSTLNYTVSDTRLFSCKYSLDNGVTNISVICGNNLTGLNSTEGTNTWTIYASDAAGNQNSSSVTFNVDTVIPESNFSYPRTNSMLNRITMINGSSTDSSGPISLVEIQVIHNNGTNNYWNGSAWITTESWLTAEGTNNWQYNVTKNNINFSLCGSNANITIKSRARDNANNYQTILNEINLVYGITTEIITRSDLIGAYHGFKINWENKSMSNYKIYYNISNINTSNINSITPYAIVNGNFLEYNSSSLPSSTWNKNYSFAVRTVDENGVESEYLSESLSSKVWRYKIEIINVTDTHNYQGEIGWRMNYRVRILEGINSGGIAILELLGPGNYSIEIPNKVQWIGRSTQTFNGFLSIGSQENYNSGLIYDSGDYKGWNMIWNMLPSQPGNLEVYAEKYENIPITITAL